MGPSTVGRASHTKGQSLTWATETRSQGKEKTPAARCFKTPAVMMNCKLGKLSPGQGLLWRSALRGLGTGMASGREGPVLPSTIVTATHSTSNRPIFITCTAFLGKECTTPFFNITCTLENVHILEANQRETRRCSVGPEGLGGP